MNKCGPKVNPPQLNASMIDTLLIFRTKKFPEETPDFPHQMYKSQCPQPITNLHVNKVLTFLTDNRLFKMRTHKRFHPCHKVFNIARTKKSFLKNVAIKCFVAQTKLPSHVEVQNTKRSGLQHSCTLFQKRPILCI